MREGHLASRGVLISRRLEYQLQLGSFLLNKSPIKAGTLNTAYQRRTLTAFVMEQSAAKRSVECQVDLPPSALNGGDKGFESPQGTPLVFTGSSKAVVGYLLLTPTVSKGILNYLPRNTAQ